MSIRAFLFCDKCNPQGIRTINHRYSMIERRDTGVRHGDSVRRQFDGRRNTDGRAWFEGSLEDGIEAGWVINEAGELLCPNCKEIESMTNTKVAAE